MSRASQFWAGLGYRSEVTDTPAMTTRIVCCIVNEAAGARRGVASPEDIDTAMRLGAPSRGSPAPGDRIGCTGSRPC
ncbi:MAG: 3-hydroxyacyl-CoA dehydrogenase family protein [Chloroflexia bacterium]